ncbi:hypothetical protein CPB83DRAFT_874627 [Crepidotus variabilis]|uniref:Protein CPL1-like domain-containing protein n=1 Tax=Crepidotus variabilis TaxID=179855 RepID=A0A9P6ELG4_9AGAR|nr:hypothetical protein CPB83DRAFT_874627 [Crepidotus variabilis]
MRLSFISLVISSFSIFPLVLGTDQPKFLARHGRNRSSVPNAVTSRQHRMPRDLIDICINVKLDVIAEYTDLLGLGDLLGSGILDAKSRLCLCLKDLNIYLDTHNELKGLIQLLGRDTVYALINAVINTSPNAQQCHLPPHAHRTCDSNSPCHWECDKGYTRKGDTCVCAFPNTLCNGQCGNFPFCPSAVPKPPKKRTERVDTLAEAKATCKRHESVCGIPNHQTPLAFECVDVASTRDSCGGCSTPNPFEGASQATGKDCTSIPHSKAVGCRESHCVVRSCKSGYTPSPDQTECVSIGDAPRISKRSGEANVDAFGDVTSSALLGKVVVVIEHTLSLNGLAPSSILASTSSLSSGITLDMISSLRGDINRATLNLLSSTSVGLLLKDTNDLLDLSTLLKSMLSSCGCANHYSLSTLPEKTDLLVTSLIDLQNWCHGRSPADGETLPISSRLADLVTRLNADSKAILNVDGLLGTGSGAGTKALLATLHQYSQVQADSTTNVVDTVLQTKLASMAHLALDLRSDLHLLTTVTSSIQANDVAVVISAANVATKANTTANLIASINHAIVVTRTTLHLLDTCGCVGHLGLQHLHTTVQALLSTAIDVQSLCLSHPTTLGHPLPTPSHADISHVVSSLGLSSSVDSNMVVTGSDLVHDTSAPNSNVGVRRDIQLDTSVVYTTSLTSTQHSQINIVLGLSSKLEDSLEAYIHGQDSCLGSHSTYLKADLHTTLVSLSSCTTASAVVLRVDSLLNTTRLLKYTLQSCPLVNGTLQLIKETVDLTEAAIHLQNQCTSPTSTISHSAPTGSTQIHSLVTSAHSTPTATYPATTTFIKTVTVGASCTVKPSSTVTPIHTASAGTSDDVVLSLNHLLAMLGLPQIKSVTTVGGLGPLLKQSLNGVLNELHIGSNDVRRSETGRLALIPGGYEVQMKIYALIDFMLALVDASKSLPVVQPPSVHNPGHGSPVLAIDSELVDGILNATRTILTCQSYSTFFGGVDDLVTSSTLSLQALEGCGCVGDLGLGEVSDLVNRIMYLSLALQDWCHAHSSLLTSASSLNFSASTETGYLVEGLEKLLGGLMVQSRAAILLKAGLII